MKKNIKGFTLAEVLITLVIIGVIAAITVPSILITTQKQEYVSALKKANSVIHQSLYRISMNNGYARGDYSYLIENNKFYDEFVKEVSAIDTCTEKNDCKTRYIQKRLALNGVDISSWGMPNLKGVTTSDGIQYATWWNNMQMGLSDEDYQNISNNGSILISVDVNGERKPNKLGIDSFFFILLDKKGIVAGGSGSIEDCNKNDYGFSCAAKVLNEGKISY